MFSYTENPIYELQELFVKYIKANRTVTIVNYKTDIKELSDYFEYIRDVPKICRIAKLTVKPTRFRLLEGNFHDGIDTSYYMSMISDEERRQDVTTFHNRILEIAKKDGFSIKPQICIDMENHKIINLYKDLLPYVLEKNTYRWKIIEALVLSLKLGLTKKNLAEKIGMPSVKTEAQREVMDAIKEINKLFRKKLKVDFDLIIKQATDHKSVFFINSTDFEIET